MHQATEQSPNEGMLQRSSRTLTSDAASRGAPTEERPVSDKLCREFLREFPRSHQLSSCLASPGSNGLPGSLGTTSPYRRILL
jgi:hypothetical protein